CEGRAARPGSEEYLASEKYQLRAWPREEGLRPLIARVNALRREHAALQSNRTLRFHETDNEALLCYSKQGPDGEALVIVVDLDPHHAQSGWVRVPLAELGADPSAPTQAHDLLGGARVLWSGERQFVRLDPWELPAQVFLLRRRVRTERDFDYFL